MGIKPTAWYYEFYEKGAFPNQKILCEKVESTGCSLNGRHLIKPTLLTGIAANTLTLRLRTLKKALENLTIEIDAVNFAIKNHRTGIGGTLNTESSHLETGGAAIEEIKLDGGGVYQLHYAKIYLALYEFFTNLGSILDRLAYEINLLYKLGKWENERLDWNKLTDTKQRFTCLLEKKDSNLSRFIENQRAYFKEANNYRNRLIHDSVLSVDIEHGGHPTQFRPVLINGKQTQKPVEASEFCKECKTDVLNLLNRSYEIILQNIDSRGNPPW